MKSFLDELKRDKLDDRVLVMAFREFGRPPKENASEGTDHGTSGPVLLAGSKVHAGLYGVTPQLGELVNDDLPVTTDFRQVYEQVLENWVRLPSHAAFDGKFQKPEDDSRYFCVRASIQKKNIFATEHTEITEYGVLMMVSHLPA